MRVTAWNNGGSSFGIRVGATNRDQFFQRGWKEIEVELEGEVHRFRLTGGFWKDCPEFRDSGEPVIRKWLQKHGNIPWPKGQPPEMELVPLGSGRFRLVDRKA